MISDIDFERILAPTSAGGTARGIYRLTVDAFIVWCQEANDPEVRAYSQKNLRMMAYAKTAEIEAIAARLATANVGPTTPITTERPPPVIRAVTFAAAESSDDDDMGERSDGEDPLKMSTDAMSKDIAGIADDRRHLYKTMPHDIQARVFDAIVVESDARADRMKAEADRIKADAEAVRRKTAMEEEAVRMKTAMDVEESRARIEKMQRETVAAPDPIHANNTRDIANLSTISALTRTVGEMRRDDPATILMKAELLRILSSIRLHAQPPPAAIVPPPAVTNDPPPAAAAADLPAPPQYDAAPASPAMAVDAPPPPQVDAPLPPPPRVDAPMPAAAPRAQAPGLATFRSDADSVASAAAAEAAAMVAEGRRSRAAMIPAWPEKGLTIQEWMVRRNKPPIDPKLMSALGTMVARDYQGMWGTKPMCHMGSKIYRYQQRDEPMLEASLQRFLIRHPTNAALPH